MPLILCKKYIINNLKVYVPENNLYHNCLTIALLIDTDNKAHISTKDDFKFVPNVCIVQEHAEEEIDYDWEESPYVSGLIYSYQYIPITYDPFSGEPFNFEIKETLDISEEYNNLVSEYLSHCTKNTKKETNARYRCYERLTELLKDIQVIDTLNDGLNMNIISFLDDSV